MLTYGDGVADSTIKKLLEFFNKKFFEYLKDDDSCTLEEGLKATIKWYQDGF